MKNYHYFLFVTFFCVLFAGVVSCDKSGPISPDESEEQQPEEVSFPVREHLIDIRTEGGAAKFYNEQSGEAFIPRGVNYFYIVSIPGGLEDRFFGVDVFDAARVRSDFMELKDQGYNVVRIFLDTCSSGPGCTGKPDGKGLNPSYLDNIARTIELAKETGIHLLLTSNDLPSQGGYAQIADSAISEQFGPYRNVQFLTDNCAKLCFG